jgi:alanine-synthesizing transaminase
VCLGSKDGTFNALRVLVQQGDAVVVPSPSYPAHPPTVALAGGRAVSWEFSQDPERAAASLEQVCRQSKPAVLLLNVPTNPAGLTVSDDWWQAIGAICARYGVAILNDFVYGEMCFSGKPAESALQVAQQGVRCVEMYSLSKAYNVPGWRVGALVGDAEIVRAVARVKSNADYGLFLPLQYAAAVALTAGEDLVGATVQTYLRRVRVLTSGVQALGWEVVTPEAGACVWVRCPGSVAVPRQSRHRSLDVTRHVLEHTGVVLTPGVVFGSQWDEWLRLAAVTNEERLREVVRALQGLFEG